MATLSLKELRTSTTLKSEISALEVEKEKLLEQIEREKQVQKKLQHELTEQKKDYEHLEKQFEHFANLEADFEALQNEIQLERLENMISSDKKDAQLKNQIQKAKEESTVIQKELKELKKLDPVRLKRQVSDLKKKSIAQAAENKTVNKALVTARKELKEIGAEKDKLEADNKAGLSQTDHFWESTDGEWALFETALVLKDEEVENAEEARRIKCLNTMTGVSVVSNIAGPDASENDMAEWLGDMEIPEDVSIEAGKRLKNLASDTEEDD